jgi:hypothetical protein
MDQEEVLRCAKQALDGLDSEALVACYAPKFLFEDTASGERITNKLDLLAYFNRLFTLPNVSFSNVSFFSLGERAGGQWVWGGSSLESGTQYAVRGASLFRLGTDGITEEIIYYDPRKAYA